LLLGAPSLVILADLGVLAGDGLGLIESSLQVLCQACLMFNLASFTPRSANSVQAPTNQTGHSKSSQST